MGRSAPHWWLHCLSDELGLHPVRGVVVTAEDVEGVSVDLNITADRHVGWHDELVVVVNVLVLLAVEELAWNDSRVLLSGLVDRDAVVAQVERDNEAAVDILWDGSVEPGSVSEHVLVVVHGLEEVDLWLLWHQSVHLAESVDLVSESIVRWLLNWDWLRWEHVLDVAQWEVVTVPGEVEVASELIDTLDDVGSAVGADVARWSDLVGGQVVVADEVLAWLVHIEALWKSLSPEEESEGIAAVVWMVDLTDLEGIISKVVVDDVLEVIALAEEAEHLTVVVKELLLGLDLASAEGLLEELLHLSVLLWWDLDLGDGEVVLRRGIAWWQLSSQVRLQTEKHNTVSI